MRVRARTGARSRRSRGQATVELIGYLPYMFVFFFMVIQAFAYIMTIEQVESAARAGARVESQGGNGTQAAHDALPKRWQQDNPTIRVIETGSTAKATVTAKVPVLLRAPINWKVTRDASIPIG